MQQYTIQWGPVRSLLEQHFSFGTIKEIVGYTCVDMLQIAHLEQTRGRTATKSQLLSAIDEQIKSLPDDEKRRVVTICCEEMLRRKSDLIVELKAVFARVGWTFSGTNLLPREVFDPEEIKDIHAESRVDIEKAAVRLRDGDLSGSLSASCGAIESVVSLIYKENNLGDPDKDSFQQRITKSIEAIGIKEALKDELGLIGWPENDIKPFISNLVGSLNHAAFVMQKLRSSMGDVHGTKPIIPALVYDSLKWSLLIIRLLCF